MICAYNEAGRIDAVLKTVAEDENLAEVIVVDDGSTDGTDEVVRRYPKVKLLVQEKNAGKSRALVRGVVAAQSETVLLLDADLRGLTHESIRDLIEPVRSGKVDVTISLRHNAYSITKAIGIDFVSGERVIPRSLITDYAEEIQKLPPFGLETFMNERIIEKKLRVAIVPVTIENIRKREKRGWWKGTVADFIMAFQILQVLSPVGLIRQNYNMLKLKQAAR